MCRRSRKHDNMYCFKHSLINDIKTITSILIPNEGGEIELSMQVQIAAFCKDFNEKTAHIKPGIPLRTEISVNPDRTYNITLLNPPTSYFLLQAAGCQKGATKPGKQTCGMITLKHVYEIAKIKGQDSAFACMTMEEVCKTVIANAYRIGIKVLKDPVDAEELREFQEKRAEEVAEEEKELEELRLSKMLRL